MPRTRNRSLRIRGGIITHRAWTPTYVLNQQRQSGIEYQSYGLDADGKVVYAGVTRHEGMNRAIGRQIHRVWARWRKEYDSQPENVTRDYPAKHCPEVTRLVVFPVGSPEMAQTFEV